MLRSKQSDILQNKKLSQHDAELGRITLEPVKTGKLLGIWFVSGTAAFMLLMLIYTQFFGRNMVTLNETIYEKHRFVGKPGQVQLATGEGYGLTTYGHNGLIVNKPLNPDIQRVLFIGDSFVKAKQVSDVQKFTELVEVGWNEQHPDEPIQTLNLGLGGQDMTTYLSFGKNMDEEFQPDRVFLWINRGDFSKVSKNPKLLEQVAQGLEAQGLEKPIAQPERSNRLRDLINDLGFRSFFGQLQAQTFAYIAGEEAQTAEAAPILKAESSIGVQLEALKQIWGDRLVIIYYRSVPDMGRNAPMVLEDQILAELEAHNIPVINLYPVFWQAFQHHRPPVGFTNSILGQGHLNAYGHQLIADTVVQYMTGEGQ